MVIRTGIQMASYHPTRPPGIKIAGVNNVSAHAGKSVGLFDGSAIDILHADETLLTDGFCKGNCPPTCVTQISGFQTLSVETITACRHVWGGFVLSRTGKQKDLKRKPPKSSEVQSSRHAEFNLTTPSTRSSDPLLRWEAVRSFPRPPQRRASMVRKMSL